MICAFEGKKPLVKGCFIAENATVIGDVTLESGVSVWYGAVVRGDMAAIKVGEGSNLQDNCVIHNDACHPTDIGKGVTVGHSAIVHGARIEDNVMIGMHATLLNGCVVGENSIIAAGALVKEGQIIPPGSLAVGVPAKIVRNVTAEDIEHIKQNALHYVQLAERHKKLLVCEE